MDWIFLITLIPLVLAPIILLAGFSGCDQVFGLDYVEPEPTIPAPSGLTATAVGITRIALTWDDNAVNTTSFTLERKNVLTGITTTIPGIPAIPGTPPQSNSYADSGLEEATEYEYRVMAIADDVHSPLSESANEFTLTWKTSFDQGPTATQGTNQGNFARDTVVQRISAANLLLGGPDVRITLRGSTANDLILDLVTISRANDQQTPLPTPTPDAWDSVPSNLPGGLKQIATSILVQAGASVVVEGEYDLDKTGDLLVAFDFSPTGNVRQRSGVTGASFYRKLTIAEAGVADRSAGYASTAATVVCIEKIEVAAPV